MVAVDMVVVAVSVVDDGVLGRWTVAAAAAVC